MKTVTEYFDELKEITGSDYKSAAILKVEQASITTWKKRGQISDETALKLAKALGKEPKEILSAAAVARSKGEVKSEWEKIYKSIVGITLFFAVVMIWFPAVEEKIRIMHKKAN